MDTAVDNADWSSINDVIKQDLFDQFEHSASTEHAEVEADISFDIFSEQAKAYSNTRAAELVTDISKTTRTALRTTVSAAIEKGVTNKQLAKTIMDSFQFSEERSLMIARTELAFADIAGHNAVSSAAGAVGKRWLLSNDDPCDECLGNEEEDVIPYDEAFTSGDDFAPAHPNCCCDFQAIYPDDPDAEDLLDDGDDGDTNTKLQLRAPDSAASVEKRDQPHVSEAEIAKRQVDSDAHQASTSSFNYQTLPTRAQIKAGNYKMGHVDIGGLDITIENPAGSVRRGKTPEGTPWQSELTHHYGYVKRTIGADGDHVDVLVRQGMDTNYSGPVWVVDQYIGAKFDEHKCLVGWASEIGARNAYLDQYQVGWDGLEAITQMTMDEFKDWLKNGNTTQPVSVDLGNEE